MEKIRCMICGKESYSASEDTQCECGGKCKIIARCVMRTAGTKETKKKR